MPKKLSNRAQRRKIERDLAKGKSISGLDSNKLIYNLKYKLNETQSQNLINSLSSNKIKDIRSTLFPNKYSELRANRLIYDNDDIIKEIIWYTKEFEDYFSEINTFVKLENEFECEFLSGNYLNASKIIDAIESTICVSQWSIEKKLLIAEYQTGFKKNKEILTGIIDLKNDPVTNMLSRYQSIRVEKNLSFFKYEEIITNLLNTFGEKEKKTKEYLNFKLNFFSQLKYEHKGFILNIENSSSLVDKYNTFVSVILLTISEREEDFLLISAIKDSLKKLSLNIQDNRLTNILYSIGENPPTNITDKNIEFIKILDLYTEGKYQEVIDKCDLFLLENPNLFPVYEIYCKSLIIKELPLVNLFTKDTFAYNSLNNIYNIICKNNYTQTSLENLHKILNSLGLTTLSYDIFTFIHSEHSYRFDEINIESYGKLNSFYFNPINSIIFKKFDNAFVYLDNVNSIIFSSTCLFFMEICKTLCYGSLLSNVKNVDLYRSSLYQAKTSQVIGKYEIAIDEFNKILGNPLFDYENSLEFNKIEIAYGLLICFLSLERFKEALILVADQNIYNPNFNNKLRSNFLLKKISELEDIEIESEISTSIVLHQYQTYVNSNDIWIAYDNFLSSYNLNYPKELENILDKLDKGKSIYFLNNICRQDVYDSSYWFENQDELDNERIEICSLLTRLDKINFEKYINEISEINRSLLIRRGIKQIDESKIYVDVKGVKKSLEKDIKESFERSLNLLNLSLDQIQKLDLNSENVIVPYYDKSPETNKIEFKENDIKITSYSRFQQFLDMFYKIRDKFIASNEYGIDTYLSMRIRHGTLLGEIRSVFENYYLITKKEDNSSDYKDNLYWKKLNLTGEVEINKHFNNLLSVFSSNIDTISDELKNIKLQIKTEKKESSGFFDYAFETHELLGLFSNKIGAIDNFDDFFEEIFVILWERTEENLSKIRIDISENIKEYMVNTLMNLSKDVEILINKNEYPEVNELIRNITLCQTDIKNELDKIAAWFKRTNSKSINEFNIHLPIDSTQTTLKRLFKDYQNLSIDIVSNCEVKFEGEYFPHFCYIFQNLLHNIIEHSKLQCSDLNVWIDISEQDGQLVIVVRNNFSEEINISQLNEKIELTKLLLLESDDNDKIRAEQGTGYLKINKTLKSDLLKDAFSININPVSEDRMFITEICFNINNLQKIAS
jgi:hypothetical protein